MTRSMNMPWKRLLVVGSFALVLLVGLVTGAWSASLDDAKAIGLIGERPDGYVAAVQPNPSPDIAALVQQVNSKRRAAYAGIAAKEGVPIEQVGALTAEKIRAQARPGEYFLTPSGSWAQE